MSPKMYGADKMVYGAKEIENMVKKFNPDNNNPEVENVSYFNPPKDQPKTPEPSHEQEKLVSHHEEKNLSDDIKKMVDNLDKIEEAADTNLYDSYTTSKDRDEMKKLIDILSSPTKNTERFRETCEMYSSDINRRLEDIVNLSVRRIEAEIEIQYILLSYISELSEKYDIPINFHNIGGVNFSEMVQRCSY